MVDAGGRLHLPIACTLGPADGDARLQQWRRLLASHRTGGEHTASYLEVRFRVDDAITRELDELVAAERECCSFVDWSLTRDEGELVLRISGEDAALATFSF